MIGCCNYIDWPNEEKYSTNAIIDQLNRCLFFNIRFRYNKYHNIWAVPHRKRWSSFYCVLVSLAFEKGEKGSYSMKNGLWFIKFVMRCMRRKRSSVFSTNGPLVPRCQAALLLLQFQGNYCSVNVSFGLTFLVWLMELWQM